jgi:hypothetical protein
MSSLFSLSVCVILSIWLSAAVRPINDDTAASTDNTDSGAAQITNESPETAENTDEQKNESPGATEKEAEVQKPVVVRAPRKPTADLNGDDVNADLKIDESQDTALPTLLSDDNEDHRANLCEISEKVYSGKLPLKDALKHMPVSIAFTYGDNDQTTIYKQGKDGTGLLEGYSALLIQELDNRANFDPTVYYVPPKNMSSDSVWDDWVDDAINRYDILVGMLAVKTNRMQKSKAFTPYALVDKSSVLISNWNPGPTWSFESIMLNVFKPFTPGVWIVCGLVMVVSSYLFWLLELKTAPDFKDAQGNDIPAAADPAEGMARALYGSLIAAAQNHELVASTVPGRVLACSWTLLGLIMCMFYSAMLVTFAVVTVETPRPWNSLEQFMKLDSKVNKLCLTPGSEQTWVEQNHPNFKNFHITRTPVKDLVAGHCDGAIAAYQNVMIAQTKQRYNPDCRLDLVERLRNKGGGWLVNGMPREKTGSPKCTRVLRDALELHFNDLKMEGRLESIWNDELLPRVQTRTFMCSAENNGDTTVPEPICIFSLLGAFLFHIMLCFLLLGSSALLPLHTELLRLGGRPEPTCEGHGDQKGKARHFKPEITEGNSSNHDGDK